MVTAFGGAMSGMDVVWDVRNPGHPERLSGFEGGQPTALSPDGRTVATVAFHGRAGPWTVASPRHPAELTTLDGGDGGLRGQVFSPDGRVLAAAYDYRVLLWDVASPARPQLLSTLYAPVARQRRRETVRPAERRVLPAGTMLASATGTNQVAVWNVADPARAYRLATLGGTGGVTEGLAFSPGGNLLAVLNGPGTVAVYSLANPAHPVRTAAVSGLLFRARYPDGQPKPDESALRRLRPGQLRGGVRPRRAHPDRCHQPHGDERQLRARHHLRLARDQLRDFRRQHNRHPRRRRLPALHNSRRPRDGQPGQQPRLAHLAAALTRPGKRLAQAGQQVAVGLDVPVHVGAGGRHRDGRTRTGQRLPDAAVSEPDPDQPGQLVVLERVGLGAGPRHRARTTARTGAPA